MVFFSHSMSNLITIGLGKPGFFMRFLTQSTININVKNSERSAKNVIFNVRYRNNKSFLSKSGQILFFTSPLSFNEFYAGKIIKLCNLS